MLFNKVLAAFVLAVVASLLFLFGANTLFGLGAAYTIETVLAGAGLFYLFKFVAVAVFDSVVIRAVQAIASLKDKK